MLSESTRRSLESTAQQCAARVGMVSEYLVARGISETTARTYRLGYEEQGEYAGRLTIPYITADGSVVDVRYRALNGEQSPKYMSRPGSKTHLFSVSSLLRDGGTIYIAEGEIDAMTLNQCGLAAVGVPGANSWQEHWKRLFADYDNVVVVCDGDQAGRDFGKRVVEKIDGAAVVHLPDGEDSNSMLVNFGADALLAKVGL